MAWISIVRTMSWWLIVASLVVSAAALACVLVAAVVDAVRRRRVARSATARGDIVDLTVHRSMQRAGAGAGVSVAQRAEDVRRVERSILGERSAR